MSAPSYHDLYITTAEIPHRRLFDLPYGLEVTCAGIGRVPGALVTVNRVAGWELWQTASDIRKWKLLAGEFEGPDKWLILDVAGHVIVDSRPPWIHMPDRGNPDLHRHPTGDPHWGWMEHAHAHGWGAHKHDETGFQIAVTEE